MYKKEPKLYFFNILQRVPNLRFKSVFRPALNKFLMFGIEKMDIFQHDERIRD